MPSGFKAGQGGGKCVLHLADNVTVVATFPDDSHAPIIYPAALIAGTENDAAPEFLDFLSSDTARPLFERQGFTVIE